MQRTIKQICIIVVLSICTSCFSGCLGATSLEKYGYVLTVGLDKGEQYKYKISFLLESEITQTEQDSSSQMNIISAEGDNIKDSIYIAEAGLPYRLNFSRASYIVIGFDVAADGEIMEFFSSSWGQLKIRTSSNMIISQSTAAEFMKGLKYTSDINATKLENSLIDFYKTEGLTSIMSVTDFVTAVKEERYDAVVPLGATDNSVESKEQSDTTDGVEREGGMISYTLGAALFCGKNMCGVISGKETQILLLIRGELKEAIYQFVRNDKTTYSVTVGNAKAPRVKVNIVNNEITVDYTIPIAVTLEQDTSQKEVEKMRKTGSLSREMKSDIIAFLDKSCKTLFEDTQKLGCDALGIGKYISMQTKTGKEWESFNAKAQLKNIRCSFKTEIEVEDIYISSYME